ncbi:hypothetical protein CHL76_10865 [Marinococcus halophilus]|uniref:Esterase n=1 Tax=Marinococcus halophilus TaxID=1371 RepID=A0A510Y5S3_MARHA|nr:alpha/beta hydrolase [Marinococcus halophilus]OZT79883.1 hypothetical protein CHL76_10865 [Marinococcus halophilus]GEK58709.1 esterase [Marinococcus halophilus]
MKRQTPKRKLHYWILSLLGLFAAGFSAFILYTSWHEDRPVISVVKSFADGPEENAKDGPYPDRPAYQLPEDIDVRYDYEKMSLNGMNSYVLKNESAAERKIIYLHGGGYVSQPNPRHFQWLAGVQGRTDSTAILPVYPKAPQHQYEEAFDKLVPLYEQTLKTTEAENIVIMGDSAGGGLALALAQELNRQNIAQPGDIIMLSPWLDVSMTNPGIQDLTSVDPFLDLEWLLNAGSSYAGDADLRNPMVSPIYGDMTGLGDMTLIIGTHELFLADARKFSEITDEKGIPINYYEYPEMPHVFQLQNTEEGRRATQQVVNIINDEAGDTSTTD